MFNKTVLDLESGYGVREGTNDILVFKFSLILPFTEIKLFCYLFLIEFIAQVNE